MKKTLKRVVAEKKTAKLSGEVVVDRLKLGLEVIKVLLALHGFHWS